MASGPKHYKLAEEILAEAKRFMTETLAEASSHEDLVEVFANHAQVVAQAQVHATLALAAATAQNIRRNGAVEADADEWAAVLS